MVNASTSSFPAAPKTVAKRKKKGIDWTDMAEVAKFHDEHITGE
jgi:hypothetical protein